jgi:hypothetical protein
MIVFLMPTVTTSGHSSAKTSLSRKFSRIDAQSARNPRSTTTPTRTAYRSPRTSRRRVDFFMG